MCSVWVLEKKMWSRDNIEEKSKAELLKSSSLPMAMPAYVLFILSRGQVDTALLQECFVLLQLWMHTVYWNSSGLWKSRLQSLVLMSWTCWSLQKKKSRQHLKNLEGGKRQKPKGFVLLCIIHFLLMTRWSCRWHPNSFMLFLWEYCN